MTIINRIKNNNNPVRKNWFETNFKNIPIFFKFKQYIHFGVCVSSQIIYQYTELRY